MNSYSVKITPAELRHAEYSEPVKWAIYEATRYWSVLWDKYGVVTIRDSVRLKNTSVVAEMFMILDTGFDDAGELKIDNYYKGRKSKDEAFFRPLREKLDIIVSDIIEKLGSDFADTTFFDAPNFLALYAAIAYLKGWMPDCRVTDQFEIYPQAIDWNKGTEALSSIAQIIEDNDKDQRYADFVSATASSTHRLSSRKVRFRTLVGALAYNAT